MPDLPESYVTSNPDYSAFSKRTHADGALDAKTKELMHFALVLALNCEP